MTAPDRFANRMQDEALSFGRDESGEVRELIVRQRANVLRLRKVQSVALPKTDLRGFAGRYYSPELRRHYRLTVRRGKLGLRLFGLWHVPFLPLEGDRFLADLAGNNCLVFNKDGQGRITGFSFYREGVAGLAFTKEK